MGKVLLFYQYVEIAYPQQIAKWQRRLCESLNLTGRIIVAHEGINGTVGGSLESTTAYAQELQAHELFGDIDIKESAGSAEDFPRLAVMIKKEICHLGISPSDLTVADSGTKLTPQEAHELMQQRPADLVILDARNNYESEVGSFEHAIKPDIDTFREFPEYIDSNLEEFRDKQVLMYCTGGVRCERATAYLNKKGVARSVYHISGGIHRYAEQFPDGFFRGKNYVFDKRMALTVTDDILGACRQCQTPYDRHRSCANTTCTVQILICDPCATGQQHFCKESCAQASRGAPPSTFQETLMPTTSTR